MQYPKRLKKSSKSERFLLNRQFIQLNIFYDSVTNLDPKETKIKDLNHMYIVYENDKAYPFYIIEYDLDNFKGSRISGPKNPIEFIKN